MANIEVNRTHGERTSGPVLNQFSLLTGKQNSAKPSALAFRLGRARRGTDLPSYAEKGTLVANFTFTNYILNDHARHVIMCCLALGL